MLKKTLKYLLGAVCVMLGAAAALVVWLTVTEYKPGDVESLELTPGNSSTAVSPVDEIKILSFNIGYGALGREADFFMDGGESVRPESAEVISENCRGIAEIMTREDADIYLLQEVDYDSKRSYGVDEAEYFYSLTGMSGTHALNYRCDYVPFPLPTIGRVSSGLLTLSSFKFDSAERVSLPCPFSWPVSAANLKRALLVSRFDVDGSDKSLVVIYLHLEAYDSGEGKAAQTKVLLELLEREYAEGNYVVAFGDFNQSFPGGTELYPIADANKWTPGVLTEDMIPDGWSFVYDSTGATCRLLDAPFSEQSQLYVIDGGIISPNVELVTAETLDEGFVYSDHNPVAVTIKLK